jgi:hypothetical protein
LDIDLPEYQVTKGFWRKQSAHPPMDQFRKRNGTEWSANAGR